MAVGTYVFIVVAILLFLIVGYYLIKGAKAAIKGYGKWEDKVVGRMFGKDKGAIENQGPELGKEVDRGIEEEAKDVDAEMKHVAAGTAAVADAEQNVKVLQRQTAEFRKDVVKVERAAHETEKAVASIKAGNVNDQQGFERLKSTAQQLLASADEIGKKEEEREKIKREVIRRLKEDVQAMQEGMIKLKKLAESTRQDNKRINWRLQTTSFGPVQKKIKGLNSERAKLEREASSSKDPSVIQTLRTQIASLTRRIDWLTRGLQSLQESKSHIDQQRGEHDKNVSQFLEASSAVDASVRGRAGKFIMELQRYEAAMKNLEGKWKEEHSQLRRDMRLFASANSFEMVAGYELSHLNGMFSALEASLDEEARMYDQLMIPMLTFFRDEFIPPLYRTEMLFYYVKTTFKKLFLSYATMQAVVYLVRDESPSANVTQHWTELVKQQESVENLHNGEIQKLAGVLRDESGKMNEAVQIAEGNKANLLEHKRIVNETITRANESLRALISQVNQMQETRRQQADAQMQRIQHQLAT